MSEAAFVNFFTVLRIVLVGGILLVIPLITRKGLLFGAYVGEELVEQPEARRIMRGWYRGSVLVMALSLVVGLGIGLVGSPIDGNLISAVVLLLSFGVLYLRQYYAARRLAPPQTALRAGLAAAPLEQGEPRGAALAKLVLAVCILCGLGAAFYTMAHFESMPDPMPTHFNAWGAPDAWSDKSVVSVMLLPTLNLVMGPFIALFALLTAHAKRSVRGGSGGRSVEAQNAFRAGVANLLSGTALFVCAMMTFFSVQTVRIGLGQIRSIGPGIMWIVGGMLVFILGSMIRIMAKYGQGGALVETGSAEAPLTDGLADNTRWVWGVFYVNRDDPSILVEKRFGIGYTINFGNPRAVAILGTFLLLVFGVLAIALLFRS